MFDIGFGELLLLFVLFFVLFGPEKLPEVARGVGKFYSEIKNYFEDLKDGVEKEIKLEEFKKINKINGKVENLILPPDEVERRRKIVLEKRKNLDGKK